MLRYDVKATGFIYFFEFTCIFDWVRMKTISQRQPQTRQFYRYDEPFISTSVVA